MPINCKPSLPTSRVITNMVYRAKESGDKQVLEEFLKQLHLKARDHSRAPMQVWPLHPIVTPRSD